MLASKGLKQRLQSRPYSVSRACSPLDKYFIPTLSAVTTVQCFSSKENRPLSDILNLGHRKAEDLVVRISERRKTNARKLNAITVSLMTQI